MPDTHYFHCPIGDRFIAAILLNFPFSVDHRMMNSAELSYLYQFPKCLLQINSCVSDQGYRGELAAAVQRAYECVLELTKRLGEGFVVEPWHPVVERTFAWLENSRCLCRDYEGLPEHHQGVVYMVMIRLMLRWLTNNRRTRKNRLH